MSNHLGKIKVFTFLLSFLLGAILLFLPHRAHAEALQYVLNDNESIKNVWQTFINIVDSLLIVVLIAIAFVEILHINIDTYGIKKILPSLILAIVGANLASF